MSNKTIIIASALSLGLGVFFGSQCGSSSHTSHHDVGSVEDSMTTWTCSMHPQVQQPEEGDCPLCGMDLIPQNSSGGDGGSTHVHLSDSALKLAEVQTSTVQLMTPVQSTRLRGTVAVSETTEFAQTSHISGRIERLMVTYKGQRVEKGDVVAWIYSPELVTAQEELLEAAKLSDINPSLLRATKSKLRNWKLSEQQIEGILRKGKAQEELPIVADLSGTVMKLNVALGDHLMMGQQLYQLADLSTAWVLFDLYERDLAWVKEGDTVLFSTRTQPDIEYTGSIQFIDPVVNERTRTTKARVLLDNRSGSLRTGQWVSGTVQSSSTDDKMLVIPKSAVLWTGTRSVVYQRVQTTSGAEFVMKEVVLGREVDDGYIVQSGLDTGEEIVTNGAFVVDSAAQLRGTPSMMTFQSTKDDGAMSMSDHSAHMMSTEQLELSVKSTREFKRVFQGYMSLKDALVSDDADLAMREASILQGRVQKVSLDELPQNAEEDWLWMQGILTESLSKISKTADLSFQRTAFVVFSKHWIAWMQRIGTLGETVYTQYCPMANDNQGASWLSTESNIANPYFGASMLTCGEIEETWKPD